MAAAFVDTNVLLYAASNLPAERRKSSKAREIVTQGNLVLSTQVLQEFYWVATRPNKLALTHAEAVAFIDLWKMFPVQSISLGIVEDALFLCSKFLISYWDAAIIAAARHKNCDILFSEDLNNGQEYDGVTAVNPFLDNKPLIG
jgi:predicted nucleic acid-binding protein